MKKTLLITLLLLFTLSTLSFAGRKWNFRNWSQATISNMTADAVNWTNESATRFSNKLALPDNSILTANGVVVAETQGLIFGTMGAAKLRVDYNTNPGRLMLNGGSLTIKVPDCLEGDTLTVVTMTASSGVLRGITTSANCTRLSGEATSADTLFNVFVVNQAGTISLTTTAGLHFRETKVVNKSVPLIKPLLVSKTPSTLIDVATSTVITLTYSQNIAIKSAAGIKVNDVAVAATVDGKVLTIPITLAFKTLYKITVDSAAISHLENANLVADKQEFTFTTISALWRDKVTMLGSGTFTANTAYAFFIRGGTTGYMVGGQISCTATDVLKNVLDNKDLSFWVPVLADTLKKVWNFRNYASGKYLGYRMSDSTIVVSSTPVGWQISLVGNNGTYNWQNNYAFFPALTDSNPYYDFAILPGTLKIGKLDAAVGLSHCICPMISPVSYGETQVYSKDYYVTLNARAGYQFYQDGTNLVYGTPVDVNAGQWKFVHQSNGRYTLKNRLTGHYMTYVNDTTVSVLPENSAGDKEWGFIYNSTQSGKTLWYTVWGSKNALYGRFSLTPSARLGVANSGNSSSTGAYMIRPVITTISYIVAGGKPVVSVPSVTTRAINLSWTENKEAAKYIIKATYRPYYKNGDSIGVLNGKPIYKQIPYIVDSICVSIDTVSGMKHTISNLELEKMYYFNVTPVSPTGLQGTTSDVVSAQTVSLSNFTPVAPVLGEITMKTISLSWVKNPEAKWYTVYSWSKPDSSDLKATTVTSTSAVISGFKANTKIYFSLQLHEDFLPSKPSAIVYATTLPYSNLKMTSAYTSNVLDKSMTILWDAAVDAVSYNIYYSNDVTKLSSAAPINTIATSANISGLIPETSYYIQICAVDEKGVLSARSETKIQKTTKLVGLENANEIGLSVISESSTLRILNAKEKMAVVYSITGKKIFSQSINSDDELLNTNLGQGLYLVRVDNQTVKAMVK